MLPDRALGLSPFLSSDLYGATILSLHYATCIPAFIHGIIMMISIKNWASLVTNRQLFIKLLYVNLLYLVLAFSITGWFISVFFLTFKGVKWDEVIILPAYLLLL